MAKPRIPRPDARASISEPPAPGDRHAQRDNKEIVVHFDHRTEARASHAPRPARDQFPDYRERMLCIRQRVADGAYSTPSMIAAVARRILDSGVLR